MIRPSDFMLETRLILNSREDWELSVNLLLINTVEIFDRQHLNLVIKIKLEKKNSNY